MNIPTREYWIGDPCYVITKDNDLDWEHFLDATGFCGAYHMGSLDRRLEYYEVPPNYDYGGTKVAAASTGGDGAFIDDVGRVYNVDSGSLACIPMSFLNSMAGTHDGVEDTIVGLDMGRIVTSKQQAASVRVWDDRIEFLGDLTVHKYSMYGNASLYDAKHVHISSMRTANLEVIAAGLDYAYTCDKLGAQSLIIPAEALRENEADVMSIAGVCGLTQVELLMLIEGKRTILELD